jgi:hypothetical protein
VKNVASPLLDNNPGAASEAPRQQIAGRQPYEFPDMANQTRVDATPQHAAPFGDGAIAIRQDAVNNAQLPPTIIDPMKLPLNPLADITPEAAVVQFPKPIHMQQFPLNRYPKGNYARPAVMIVSCY